MAPVFSDPKHAAGQEIYTYFDYKPWGRHTAEGGDWSNYPADSGRILDLKQNRPGAIRHFAGLVERDLGDNFAIAVVPSHDPTKRSGGLISLARKLASLGNRIDASSCLVRTVKIQKLADGGDRSIDVHLQSIVVQNTHLIDRRDVLLLDDITTTGNSLRACRQLLLDAGARNVQCVAIGQTL